MPEEAIDIFDIPFNHFLGITESEKPDYLLQLASEEQHRNHVGSIHAAALFALAEATSGEYLIQRRGERTDIVGLLRRSTSKYSNPAHGVIYGSAEVTDDAFEAMVSAVDAKGKGLLDIAVKLDDENGVMVASFTFTWLLAESHLNERSL